MTQVKVSKSFLSRVRTIFYTNDTNKDGKLTKEDFVLGCKSRLERPKSVSTKEDIEEAATKLWNSLDVGDSLSFEELLERHTRAINDPAWKIKMSASYGNFSKFGFEKADANENGLLSKDEFVKFYAAINGDLSDTDDLAGAAFDAIEKKDPRNVTYEEYHKWQIDYCFTDNPDEAEGKWGWLIPDQQWEQYRKSVDGKCRIL